MERIIFLLAIAATIALSGQMTYVHESQLSEEEKRTLATSCTDPELSGFGNKTVCTGQKVPVLDDRTYSFGARCNRTCSTNRDKTDVIECRKHIGGGKWSEISQNCTDDSPGCEFSEENVTLTGSNCTPDDNYMYTVGSVCNVNCTNVGLEAVFRQIKCQSTGRWDYMTSSTMKDYLCAEPCPFNYNSSTGFIRTNENCTQCPDGMTTYDKNRTHCTSEVMCYQCADSSSNEGKNQCQTYRRTMRKYRSLFEKENTIIPEKYVKNCTGFSRNEKTYCKIVRVELRGNIITYLRGCSNGTDFGLEFTSEVRGLDVIKPDNQTTCSYNGQGYLICFTLCEGSFCNGPESALGATVTPPSVVILMILAYLVLCLNNSWSN